MADFTREEVESILAEIAQAKEAENAEEEFEEAYRKHEKDLIESGEKKDEIRAAAKGLKQAEIQVKRAKMDLEKTKIHAPYSGTGGRSSSPAWRPVLTIREQLLA